MKRFVVLLALAALWAAPALAATLDERVAESRAAVKEFANALKVELDAAMAEGGPTNAMAVCNLKAPDIAALISERHGWRIGRTSLKVRNQGNAPDAWERKVLEDFERRHKAGKDPAKMEYYQVVDERGVKVFRYMKAIPTAAKPCLACHGTNIAPEVEGLIDGLYPGDQARGYKAGDIRGAFTIRQEIE